MITEPFEKMAMDLVGPFTRSHRGFKYILTTICLASKYPDVIPIRNMSAASVADGLLEIFSNWHSESRTLRPRVSICFPFVEGPL